MSRRLIAIGMAATLGLLAVWYYVLWSPQSASLQHARSNATAAHEQEATLKSQVAALQKQRAQLPALQAQVAQLNLAIPAKPQIDTFIDDLNAAALGSGVAIQSFSPSAPVVPVLATTPTTGPVTTGAASTTATTSSAAAAPAAQPLSSINLTMTGDGTYTQLVDFINRLTGLSRLTVVDGVNFAAGQQGKPMTASISAHVFESPSATTATPTVGSH